jgi:GDP-mannose 6-dehydrogenase
MNPEFLREGTAISDFFNPPYILIGTNSKKSFNLVKKMYSGIDAELIKVAPEIAEMIKFVNNSYHALKITFANEIGNICHDLNIDSIELMALFTKDRQLNISPKYFKPGFAYGGSCLPKDLEGIFQIAKDLNIETPVLKSIKVSNDYQIKRLIKLISKLNSNKLGFLGISFKDGTDDVRNSPILDVISHFIENNYKISAYDPNVNDSILKGINKQYLIDHIGTNSQIFLEDAIRVCNEAEVIIITNSDQKYFIADKHFLNKIIIDLSRSFSHLSNKTNYYNLN